MQKISDFFTDLLASDQIALYQGLAISNHTICLCHSVLLLSLPHSLDLIVDWASVLFTKLWPVIFRAEGKKSMSFLESPIIPDKRPKMPLLLELLFSMNSINYSISAYSPEHWPYPCIHLVLEANYEAIYQIPLHQDEKTSFQGSYHWTWAKMSWKI